MAVGIIGTLLPILPGLLLVWAAAIAYGLVEGFDGVGVAAMVVITALAIAGTVAGYVWPARAAGIAGATRGSMVVGAVCGVIGFFVVPVIGLPLGFALGIYLAERARTNDGTAAYRSTTATLKGYGVATLLQFAAAIAMAGTWVAWVILD